MNLLQLSDDYILSIFVSNLKPEIATSVRLFYPKTLTHAFNLAKQVESMLYNFPRKPYIPYKNALVSQFFNQPTIPYKHQLTPTHNILLPLLPTPRMPPL